MTMIKRGIADVERLFWLRRKLTEVAVPKRRPSLALSALGALALTGYVMLGEPVSTIVTTPASAPVDTLGGSSTIISDSGASTRSSIIDAAVGTLLAAGWLAAGAWIGIRSARASIPLEDQETSRTGSATRAAYRLASPKGHQRFPRTS